MVRYGTVRYGTVRYLTTYVYFFSTATSGDIFANCLKNNLLSSGSVHGSVQFDWVWYGVRYGTVRYGTVRYDTVEI